MPNDNSNSHAKPILLVPSDTPESEIFDLRRNGYTVIATDNPESIRLIDPSIPVGSNDFIMAALEGLMASVSDTPRSAFVKALWTRMSADEARRKHPAMMVEERDAPTGV